MQGRIMTFNATRLSDGRRSAHLTQVELSASLGISVATLCRYEAGKYEPSGSVLRLIAQATGKPMQWFLGDGEESVLPSEALTEDEAKFLAEWRSAGADTKRILRATLLDALRVAKVCADG